MNYETKEEILDALSFSARFIRELFPLDCAVAVTDGEKYLAVYPGKKIDPGGRAGDIIPADDVDSEVMRTGKAVSAEIPAEVYGFAFKATVIPVRDSRGQVIGTLAIGFDLTTQNELIAIAGQLAASFSEISGSSQEISASACNLSNAQQELQEISFKARDSLKKTDAILKLINNLSSQTNLLGINAAIEAARQVSRDGDLLLLQKRSESCRTRPPVPPGKLLKS